jgi:hypothetical protein
MNIDHNEKNTNPNIVQIDENPENVLRQACTEVKKSEFGSPELLETISGFSSICTIFGFVFFS